MYLFYYRRLDTSNNIQSLQDPSSHKQQQLVVLCSTCIINFGKTRVFQFRTFPSNPLSLSLFRDRLFSANAIASLSLSLPQVLTVVPYSFFLFLFFQLFSVWFIRKKPRKKKKKVNFSFHCIVFSCEFSGIKQGEADLWFLRLRNDRKIRF